MGDTRPGPARPRALPTLDLEADPEVLDVLPHDLDVGRLVAELCRSGPWPLWVRLGPYDLDQAALDHLATASLAAAPGSIADRIAVVESDDRRQAERFLANLPAVVGIPRLALVMVHPRAGLRRRGAAPISTVPGAWPALRESALRTGQRLAPGELDELLEGSRGPLDLATRLAVGLLCDATPQTRAALRLATLLGYGHPRYSALAPALDDTADLPWWTELCNGWLRLDPAWAEGLLAVCARDEEAEASLIGRLASELTDDGAGSAAIELCLDAGAHGTASDLLAGIGPALVSDGYPLAVRRWVGRLPWTARRRHRNLVAHARDLQPRRPLRTPQARHATSPARAGRAAGVGRPGTRPEADLEAQLLGGHQVSFGGPPVPRWHGRKATALLAYLLLHRDRPVPRDTLTGVFWPDVPIEVSRNRLHVALHGLRSDLLAVSSERVVVFGREGYSVNRDLAVRLDIEDFDDASARGDHHERRAEVEAALSAYQEALKEYRGDLLVDQVEDEWVALLRQHYRTRMLDLLGRCAQLAFDLGRYAEAVDAGLGLLALDFCREDTHRLLMRAYARLWRPHLALRQFDTCAAELRRELDLAPARETVELYGQIRTRAPV